MTPAESYQRGLTVSDVARLFRVRRDRVRLWIERGELKALNTADPLHAPRFVILPHHLEEFERRRAATPAKPTTRRKRQQAGKDYFPDL
jgi:hypothetical protein